MFRQEDGAEGTRDAHGVTTEHSFDELEHIVQRARDVHGYPPQRLGVRLQSLEQRLRVLRRLRS